MAQELFSAPPMKAFGFNMVKLWAVVDPDATTPVLVEAFGIKSIARNGAAGLYTVTFMEEYVNGGTFQASCEEPTGDWAVCLLRAWGANYVSAQIQYLRAALAAHVAISDGATGSRIHLEFLMRGR